MQDQPHRSAKRKFLYVIIWLIVTVVFFLLDIDIDIWNDKKFENL